MLFKVGSGGLGTVSVVGIIDGSMIESSEFNKYSFDYVAA